MLRFRFKSQMASLLKEVLKKSKYDKIDKRNLLDLMKNINANDWIY